MKDNFIIDENVIYDAWRGKDNDGKNAISDRTFVYSFLDSDKKLIMTPFIQGRYFYISKTILKDTQYMDPAIIPWFMQRVLDGTKSQVYDGLKPKFKYIKQGDDEFVIVTIHVDGHLVTKDGRLEKEIEKEGLKGKINFFDVSAAIPLIHEP